MIDPLTIDPFEICQSPIDRPIVIIRHRDPETVKATRRRDLIAQMIREFVALFHHRHHPSLGGKAILIFQKVDHHEAEFCQHAGELFALAYHGLFVAEMI
jgi:hypothetical protein